jgi:hypothetical protein
VAASPRAGSLGNAGFWRIAGFVDNRPAVEAAISMSDPRNRSTASFSLLLALVALPLLAGCGSSSDPSPQAARGSVRADPPPAGAAAGDPCEPHRLEGEVEDPPRRSEEGAREPVSIGSSELSLEVTASALPSSIPIRFAEREPFEAPPGSMLVAVSYRVENGGGRELKPSEDLNARLLLRASGALYPNAVALPCSIPLAASWSVAHGGDNPALPVGPGDSARSAVVFIVPRQQPGSALSLVLPGQVGVALRPTG